MTRKPNLLFIFTDEQRFDTLAAYGNHKIQMPNLNRLADESYVFEHSYVTQPVCTASRASILTGLYPHSHGLVENNLNLPASIPCFPEMVTDQDYAISYQGKWHLGDEIFAQHGFPEFISIEDEYRKYYSETRDQNALSNYHQFLISNGFIPQNGPTFSRGEVTKLPEEFGKPAFLAQTASQFIRKHTHDPFILFVNFLEPHMPFTGPRDHQYEPGDVDLPSNFGALLGQDTPLKPRLFARAYAELGLGMPLKTEADWRRMIANYWGLCSLVDTHVGTILATLDECELRNDTIIVFTSDHGDMMGSHHLIAKCVQFEEAVRVPLLIRLPGQRVGQRITRNVSQIDLVPTLLDLLGQPIPSHLQGQSLYPLFDPSADQLQLDDVFIEWNGPNNGLGDVKGSVSIPEPMLSLASRADIALATTDPVRTIISPDRWKFNYSPAGEHELYHLASDPGETQNLARLPEYRPRIDDMMNRIRAWQAKTADTAII